MSKPTFRYDIVRKGDGRIFVRTHNLITGANAMLHQYWMKTEEEAREWIATQQEIRRKEEQANLETVIASIESE